MAFLVGNFQPDYCPEFDGVCPYMGAFVILPGFKANTDAICKGCIMMMSCVRVYEAYKILQHLRRLDEMHKRSENE